MQKRQESQASKAPKWCAPCPISAKCQRRISGDCTTGTVARQDCQVCGGSPLDVEYREGRGVYMAGCICNNCPKWRGGAGSFFVPKQGREIIAVHHRGNVYRDGIEFKEIVKKIHEIVYHNVLKSNQEVI